MMSKLTTGHFPFARRPERENRQSPEGGDLRAEPCALFDFVSCVAEGERCVVSVGCRHHQQIAIERGYDEDRYPSIRYGRNDCLDHPRQPERNRSLDVPDGPRSIDLRLLGGKRAGTDDR